MTYPTISIQAAADGRLRVGIDVRTPQDEAITFSVFIDTTARKPQAPDRTVNQIALAACLQARHFLDDLEQSLRPAAP